MIPLLVLRPEPGAAATISRAAALGLATVAAPLFTVAPVAWEPPDPAAHDALMLTSANALRHGGEALARYHGLPAYAVGAATGAAAAAAGFTDVRIGEGDAAALLARMAAEGIRRPLHLAGREHRAVAGGGLTLTRRIVYAADPVAGLPAAAHDAIPGGAVALVHSPRAAALFARLVEAPMRARVALAAISAAAAAEAGEGWREIGIAPQPDDAALLAVAARLCERMGQGAEGRTG